jgi:hypothetical protein
MSKKLTLVVDAISSCPYIAILITTSCFLLMKKILGRYEDYPQGEDKPLSSSQ